ncbi:MAG: YdcF family protein [bacterium]|nr:YdcF family protein [bacterium]
MFFWLSKTLRLFIDPLFWIFALWGWLIWRRGGWRTRSLWLIFYLASIPAISGPLLYSLEHLSSGSPIRKDYDYILVLTGLLDLRLSEQGPAFNAAADRITEALRLYRAGVGNKLLIVGGEGALKPTGRSEAQVLQTWLLAQGVGAEDLLIGPDSRNTYENALEVRQLTAGLDRPKLLLVTSAFHLYRAQGAFAAVGVETDLYPTDFRGHIQPSGLSDFLPFSGALSDSGLVLRELTGILAYRLSGQAKFGD